jgi:hypothetical protein
MAKNTKTLGGFFMTSFIALYRGETISSASLIAVSADAGLVSDVSTRLLGAKPAEEGDPVLVSIERGRRAALRLIKREAVDGMGDLDVRTI